MTTNQTVDYAVRYAEKGWPVFPVGDNKLPAIKRWESSATTDVEQIRTWRTETFLGGCNFGFPPGRADIVVIDTDVNKTVKDDNGNPQKVNGEDSLREWLSEQGFTLPDTFTVRTPSGGLHRYYRAAGLRSKNAFLPAVDVKSSGGYVIIPGSSSAKGEYAVVNDAPVAELPQAFIDAYGHVQKPPKSEVREDLTYRTHITADTAEKLTRAAEIIDEWPEAAEGERNDQLFQLMRELCKAGISRKKAKELYADLALDKIGLDPASYEVAATIKSAYGDLSDLGSESEEERKQSLRLLDVIPQEPTEAGKPRFTDGGGIDWNELLRRTVPARKWFIENWLSADEGYTVLFSGRGGTGKSALMLDLLYSLATGTPFLGMPVLRGSKALYVSCEDSVEELTRRVHARKLDARVPDNIIRIWPRSGFDNILCLPDKRGVLQSTPFMAELQSRGREFFGTDGGVLVLDTLSDIFAGNENDRSQVSQFVKLHLNKLGKDLGVTIIVLAHPAKGSSSSGQGFSGSTAWEGAFRCRWELNYQKADKIDGFVELVLAKSNAAKAGAKITMTNAGGMFRVVDAAKADESVKDLLVQMIDEAYSSGRSFGLTAQASRPIANLKICDPVTGTPLLPDEIKSIVSELLAEAVIERYHTNKERGLRVVKREGD